MKIIPRFLIVIIFSTLIWICSCNRSTHTLYPYRWPVINKTIDSLTLAAERQWMDASSNDSIANTVQNLYKATLKLKGKQKVKGEIRTLYWEIRLLRQMGRTNEAERKIIYTLDKCDSATDPYTFGRLKELQYLSTNPLSQDFFNFLLDRMDYYEKIQDLPYIANTAIHISNSLNDPTEPLNTVKYLQLADSIYSVLGFKTYRIKNNINRASLLYAAGKKNEAKRVLEELRNEPIINEDLRSLEIILRNHFTFFKDSASLFRGYHLLNDNSSYNRSETNSTPTQRNHLKAYYEARICEFFMHFQRMDSATKYFQCSLQHIDSLHDDNLRAIAKGIYAEYYNQTNNPEEAYKCLRNYLELTDSINNHNRPHQKILLENLNTLRTKEIEVYNTNKRLRLKYYLIVAVMIIVLLGTIYIFQHRRQLQKIKAAETQIELERGKRKLMALSLSKDKSNRVLDYIKEEVNRLNRDGNVETNDISKIERNIMLHLANRNEMESFEKTFENINPDFIRRLKTISPTISENNIRICSYILIGLSNRQIADLMNIRSTSVKQARWRLRTRLGIDSEESLEDFLRKLSK